MVERNKHKRPQEWMSVKILLDTKDQFAAVFLGRRI